MDAPRPSRLGPFFWACLFAVVVILLALARAAFAQAPQLPLKVVDTTFQPPANVVVVPAGASLQAAVNAAQPGTTLLLAAGATYQPITLPNKAGSGWIYLMTNSPTLPVSGNRVFPMDAPKLAKIACASVVCVQPAAGAHHYRLVGMEFSSTGTLQNAAVNLDAGTAQPDHIIIDRSYIHGTSTSTLRRGVSLVGGDLAVIDSYVSDVHEAGTDSQAVWIRGGTGPFKVHNNYLSGAGENFMMGGADPYVTNQVPADVTFTGNWVYKPTAWQSSSWSVKNLFEVKNGRRVLAAGNIFENNWVASQNGMSILFTPRNQDGGCPQCTVEDVTFRDNVLKNVAGGINILATDNEQPSLPLARLLVTNSTLNVVGSGGNGRCFSFINGPDNVTITRVTATTCGTLAFSGDSGTSANFTFTNNLAASGAYGFSGTNSGDGNSTLQKYFVSPVFTGNVFAACNNGASVYPPGNQCVATIGAAPAGSGADLAAIATATACTVSGQCSGVVPPPNPVDTTPPVVTLTVPQSGQVLLQGASLTFQATATDTQSSVGPITFQVDGVASSSTYTFTQVGSHTVQARAVDAAGNVGTTSAAVTVNAPPPVPTDPLPCLQGPWSLSSLTQTATGFTATFTRATIQTPQPGGAACGPSSQTFTTVVR